MQTLEERRVTQYVLCKHHLVDSCQTEDVLRTVDDIVALHATSAATPYLSLHARMRNFTRRRLDDELYVKRALMRLRAMRGTLFIASTDVAPTLHQATKLPESQLSSVLQKAKVSQEEYHELERSIRDVLKGGGKTLTEIRKTLPKGTIRTVELREGKSVYKWTNLKLVLDLMVRKGIVISEKGEETLRTTKANLYRLVKEAYSGVNLESIEATGARSKLAMRYIKAFGPVTEEDIAWWTGFNKKALEEALTESEEALTQVRIDGLKGDYLMLKADHTQLVEHQPSRDPSVSLLPYEDPYTKGYKIRDRLIDKRYEKTAYLGGAVEPTIILDGKIAGTWTYNVEAGKWSMKLRFFQQPEKDMEDQVVRKARAIGMLMDGHDVDVIIRG